jgi:hypothetical protein
MTDSNDSNKPHPSVIQMLDWARLHSYKVVPLHPVSKSAAVPNYTSSDYQSPDDALWYRNPGYGVGLVTEDCGLIDVDLDCPEAVFFAERLLPPTDGIFGRPGKPRSHRLYLCLDPLGFNRMAWTDSVTRGLAKDVILELRGSGHQTVAPGSLHEGTGERITWANGKPPDGLPVHLAAIYLKGCKLVAAGVLLARHWAPGSRNHLCLWVTGMLCYYGWETADIELFMTTIIEFTGDEDRANRMKNVRATITKFEAGKPVGGLGKLRELLGDGVADQLQNWLGSEKVTAVLDYNERYAVVKFGNKTTVAFTDVAPSEGISFMPVNHFLQWTLNDAVTEMGDNGTLKSIPKAKIWLASRQRRQYNRIEFLPGQTEVDDDTLNLWTGWAVAPSSKGSCEAWLTLLREVICGGNDELYQRMLHFFAAIIRDPMRRSPCAPVIIGVPGAGKSLMVTYFGRILGNGGFVSVGRDEAVTGAFNAHLAQCLLLVSEEALYAGDKRQRGIIKDLISAETRMHQPKFHDAVPINNFTRLMLISNHERASPVEVRDRRYLSIDMGDRKAAAELIAQVVAEMLGDGPAALHQYLLDMEYDAGLLRTDYDDGTRHEQIAMNMDPLDEWWMSALQDRQMVPDLLLWGSKGRYEGDPWPPVVKVGVLYEAMRTHLFQAGYRGRAIPPIEELTVRLHRWVGCKLDRHARRFNNSCALDERAPRDWQLLSERGRAYHGIPSLEDCRDAFARYLGYAVDWSEYVMGDGELPEAEPVPAPPEPPAAPARNVVKFGTVRPAADKKRASGTDDDGFPTF